MQTVPLIRKTLAAIDSSAGTATSLYSEKFGCIEVPWINEHSVIVERSTDTFKVQNSFHRNRDHFVSVGLECLS